MHAQTPVVRKKLVDPAACGVRLGVDLRAAAEREAYRSGMCLSLWIRNVVTEAVARSGLHSEREVLDYPVRPESNSTGADLDSAYRREMEKLNDR